MFWNNLSAKEHQLSTLAPLCLQPIACYIYIYTRKHCMAWPTALHHMVKTRPQCCEANRDHRGS